MNFRDIKDTVADWLQVEELRSRIEDFVIFGQKQLERELRVRALEVFPANGTLSTGANTVALPTGYIELIYFAILDGTSRKMLFDRSTARDFSDRVPRHSGDTTNTGRPQGFTRKGSNLEFSRYANKDYDYEWAYFAHLTELADEDDTNWFTTDAPDVLVYSALMYAAPAIPLIRSGTRMMPDPRIAMWRAEYIRLVNQLRSVDSKERASGVPKRVRYVD